jgi:hypothetical protein
MIFTNCQALQNADIQLFSNKISPDVPNADTCNMEGITKNCKNSCNEIPLYIFDPGLSFQYHLHTAMEKNSNLIKTRIAHNTPPRTATYFKQKALHLRLGSCYLHTIYYLTYPSQALITSYSVPNEIHLFSQPICDLLTRSHPSLTYPSF